MDLNALNVNNSLICSIREGNFDKVKALVHTKYGLSFIEDWSGSYTLLRDATKFAHTEIAAFLLLRGAEVKSKRTGENTPLHFAGAMNEVKLVHELICRGAEVNAQNSWRETPLHWAVRGSNKDLELVQTLINGGAEVNAANFYGETPLHVAVESGSVDVVQLLCNNRACSKLDVSYFAPLHIACFKRLRRIVKLLLNKKHLLSCSPNCINLALVIASQTGDEKMVSLLLGANADPNECSKSQLRHHHHRFYIDAGSTPLFEACKNGHFGVVELLLKHGAQLNLSKFSNKYTPLHAACGKSNVEIVNLLLHTGADPNVKASDNTTPLHLASQIGSLIIVKSLLKFGVHVNSSRLPDKFAPLHLASNKAHIEIVGELLQWSADSNVKTSDNTTPLHLTAERGCSQTVQHLLDRSADVNAETCEGSTPLHFALQKRNVRVVEILLERGADVNVKDKNDDDPLYFAVRAEDSCLVNSVLMHKPSSVSTKVIQSVTGSIPNDFGNNVWIDDLIEYSVKLHACEVTHYSDVFSAAVRRGRVKIVKTLLLYGVRSDDEGISLDLLHEAVKRGHKEIVKLLLVYGWDVNVKDSSGKMPIHYTVQYYDDDECTKILQLLLENGANLKDAPLLLITAVIKNHFGVCRVLVENGIDINFKNKNSQTALHCSLIGGLEDIASFLIKSGADVNACDEDGATPLHVAIKCGCQNTTRILLRNGANVKSCQKDGNTPLHIASRKGDIVTVNLLLKLDVDINALTCLNETALHFGVRSSPEIIEVLLDNGIDVNVEDSRGQTALDYYIFLYRINILKRHIIKLKVAGLHINDKFKFNVSDRYDSELPNFQRMCKEEVEQMKRQKFSGHITLYDVVRNQRNPAYARNKSLMKTLASLSYQYFPIYQRFITNCLKRSKQRIDLLTSGQKWFDVLLRTSNVFHEKKCPVLPPEILEKIVSLLNNKELSGLILCGEDLKRLFSK